MTPKDNELNELNKLLLEWDWPWDWEWPPCFPDCTWDEWMQWLAGITQDDIDQALALWTLWQLYLAHLQWLRDQYARMGCGGMFRHIWGESEACRLLREEIENLEDNPPPGCINCPDFDDMFPDWPKEEDDDDDDDDDDEKDDPISPSSPMHPLNRPMLYNPTQAPSGIGGGGGAGGAG